MTGWEPIVVKPFVILRQIKTVETEQAGRDALLRPSEEGTPAPGAMLKTEGDLAAEFVGVLFGAAHGQIVAEVQSPKTRSRRCCETMIFVLSSFIRLSEPISRGTVTEQRNSTTRLRVSCPTSRTSEHSSARGCESGCWDVYRWRGFGTYLQHGQSPPVSTSRTAAVDTRTHHGSKVTRSTHRLRLLLSPPSWFY